MADSNYEEIAYPSTPFKYSHPDHLYSLAALFGIEAVHPDRSRILEIGCAQGDNIIPLADQIPGADILGIDLSVAQIELASSRANAAGLDKLRLETMDLRDLGESQGQFDYIICHGVYSWIAADVQAELLSICRNRLAPQGLAYVSYNTYPGWYMRDMLRQMMLHHVQTIDDGKLRIEQSRALLQFLLESTEGDTSAYAKLLREEFESISRSRDEYFFHEYLEPDNNPVFFTDFVNRADAAGLQYVSETNIANLATNAVSLKSARKIRQLTNDLVQRHQYTDFITNRKFRASLLCRKEIAASRSWNRKALEEFSYAGYFQPLEGSFDSGPGQQLSVKSMRGHVINTSAVALKALLEVLSAAYPASVQRARIFEHVRQRTAAAAAPEVSGEQALSALCEENLVKLIDRGDAMFTRVDDRFITDITTRPIVSALARQQALDNLPITTRMHTVFQADALERLLIPLLDGGADAADLAVRVARLIEEGTVVLRMNEGEQIASAAVCEAAVTRLLTRLKQSALLVG
jgi:methyltransferase-like protein/2-polyprenyl-3-methyl-5-hydroxy-6-metoxy-1,4-benzoquinol methylase